MSIRIRAVRLALLAVVAAAATLATAGGVAAHPEGEAHHNPLPAHASEVMRAFAQDSHANQNLAAVSSTACFDGFAGSYPCKNVDLEAFLPLSQIGGTATQSAANDIWGWTDSATTKEYAIIGLVIGTSFVDVSDPANPISDGLLAATPR